MSPQRSADQLKHSETVEEVAGLPGEDKMPGQTDRVERKSESLLNSNSNTLKAHSLCVKMNSPCGTHPHDMRSDSKPRWVH